MSKTYTFRANKKIEQQLQTLQKQLRTGRSETIRRAIKTLYAEQQPKTEKKLRQKVKQLEETTRIKNKAQEKEEKLRQEIKQLRKTNR